MINTGIKTTQITGKFLQNLRIDSGNLTNSLRKALLSPSQIDKVNIAFGVSFGVPVYVMQTKDNVTYIYSIDEFESFTEDLDKVLYSN